MSDDYFLGLCAYKDFSQSISYTDGLSPSVLNVYRILGFLVFYGTQYAVRPWRMVTLLRNLVQHRQYEGTHAPGRVEWFDDRIEFSNPGGPFGRASEGTFGEHSDYRNPSITKGLVELGYVQQLGRGISRARFELERNGCPPLEVETDGFIRVLVRARP